MLQPAGSTSPAARGPARPRRAFVRSAGRSVRDGRTVLALLPALSCGLLVVALSHPPPASAQCLPDPPVGSDVVTCSGNSTGFEAPAGVDDLDVTVQTGATLDESDPGLGAALGVNDANTITVEAGATIEITETGGVGILAGQDNTIDVDGTIDVTAGMGRGVSIGTNSLGSSAITTLEASGVINVVGADAVGIESAAGLVGTDPAPVALIRNRGEINVLGARTRGIVLGDLGEFTSGMDSEINVMGTDSVGILGDLDNRIVLGADTSGSTLNVLVDGGIGIQTMGVSSEPVPPGSLLRSIFVNTTGVINVLGDGATAIQVDGEQTINVRGDIQLNGLDGRGIALGDRTIFSNANIVQYEGTLTIGDGTAATANGIGIQAGDGWYPNDIGGADEMLPDFAEGSLGNGIIAVFAGSDVRVNSLGGYGMRLGDDANAAGNHNSVGFNAGTIDVMAADAVGVSLGGNDFPAPPPGATTPFSFRNDGMLIGTDADHGALVEFRAFSSGDNRILNNAGASILADLTHQGMPGRALAILGTPGVERVDNDGTIRGDIQLGAGADVLELGGAGSYEGVLDGGADQDTFVLKDNASALRDFDVSSLVNFEILRVGGGAGWSLSNAGGFAGRTQVEPNGLFVVVQPTTLGGDFTIDASGSLDVVLDPNAPMLTVAGDATLDGTLIVSSDPNVALDPSVSYALIDVGGTRNGAFATVESRSLLTRFSVEYVGDDVNVRANQQASTPNQRAIARHLVAVDASGSSSGELDRLIADLRGASGPLGPSFDALSPEAYDAQTTVLVEGGRRITRLLFDRPRDCRPGALDPWAGVAKPLPCHARKWSPWLAVTGTFRARDSFQGHARYDARLGGLVAGVDTRPLDGLDTTLAISMQRGSIDVAGAETSTLTMIDLTGQASYRLGPIRAQLAASYGHGFHRDRRVIEFPDSNQTPVTATAEDEHESDRWTLAAETGVMFDIGPLQLEPVVGLDWAWVDQDRIAESRAGQLGLVIAARDDEIGSLSAGFRFGTTLHQTEYLMQQLEWMDGVWRPQLDVRWREFLKGTDREIEGRFVGSPAGVADFTIEGEEDDGGVEVGAAVSFVPSEANRLQFDLRYEAFVGSHTLEHDLSLRVQLGF